MSLDESDPKVTQPDVTDPDARDGAEDEAEPTAPEGAAEDAGAEPTDDDPTPDDDTEGRDATDVEDETEADPETEAEAEVDADSEAEVDAASEAEAEVDPEADTDPEGDVAGADESSVEDEAEPAAPAAAARAQRRGAHARRVTPRERLRELVAPQANRTQAIIALACLVVGFGLSVQVRSSSQEASFTSLRQSELVSLLDRLNQRQEDLREELLRLQQEKAALGSEDSEAARKAAQDRQHTLAILAGTEPATGPGIDLFVRDPKDGVNAAELLNAVQELRDSGAEVLQIGDVRIAVDSYFLDAKGGVIIDGTKVKAPYRIRAIGDPHTMATAMDIPGGVLETLHRAGAEATVSESQSLTVTAVRDP